MHFSKTKLNFTLGHGQNQQQESNSNKENIYMFMAKLQITKILQIHLTLQKYVHYIIYKFTATDICCFFHYFMKKD